MIKQSSSIRCFAFYFDYMRITLFTLIFLTVYACDQPGQNYLKKIPDIETYNYFELTDWGNVENRSVVFSNWLEDGENSNFAFNTISCLIKTPDELIWVCDPIQGQLIEITSEGEFGRFVLSQGKGPNEAVKPVSIIKKETDDDVYFFVLDIAQKVVIKLDREGKEVKRLYSQYLPNRGLESTIIYAGDKSFYWSTLQHKDFVLAEWDSSGNLKRGIVPRLIPMGYQPITHNDIAFDYSNRSNLLSFAYTGLPLVFLKDISENKNENELVISLESEMELKKLNISLDPKPLNEKISVNTLIKNIYINEHIYIAYQNEIIVVSKERGKRILSIQPKDNEGNVIRFHTMKMTEDHIIIINHFRRKVYRVPLMDMIN